VHALAFEASPVNFFTDVRHPAIGAPALAAIAVAALVFALVERTWERKPARGILRVVERLLAWLARHDGAVDAGAYFVAASAAVYAGSLCVLELFGFQNGQVIVTCLWAAAGLAAVIRWRRAYAWLAVVVAKVGFDVFALTHTRYGISLAVIGGTLLAAGLLTQALPAVAVSMPLALAGAFVLIPGHDGLVLIGVGVLYTALAAAMFRTRDLATLLWILGLTVAGYGWAAAVDGGWLVLAYTATAAVLAVVAKLVRERRLQAAALVHLVVAAAITLIAETPPSHLVMPIAHPGDGLASLVLLVAAVATFAWSLDWDVRFRNAATWAAGALGVYGASLAILEVAQQLSPEDVHTNFQRGQTMVSAFWGLLALLSLYVGLRRRRGLLRVGGFVLFAVSLGKIFLFDLPSLSSAQRALSFLAVGAVLLLGGFFYQRLSAEFDQRPA
jgi:hypothetical protein